MEKRNKIHILQNMNKKKSQAKSLFENTNNIL